MALAECFAISEQFRKNSGIIQAEMLSAKFASRAYLNLIKRELWKPGEGWVHQAMKFNRSMPATVNDWTDVNSADDCDPTLDVLPVSSTLTGYNPVQKAIRTEEFCLWDLLNSAYPQQQVNNYVNMLKDNVANYWNDWYRDTYIDLSERKIVLTSSGSDPESSAAFPNTVASSYLSLGHLETLAIELEQEGAGDGAFGTVQGAPVFTVIGSPATLNNLIKDNEPVRDDIRWSSRVDELLWPLGTVKSYGSFHFVRDVLPARYNFEGGAWVRVQPYLYSGGQAIVNPAYKTALAEVTVIFNQLVFTQENPMPNFSAGLAKFNKVQNYMGNIEWINEYDLQCNYWEMKGHWRAHLVAAARPGLTQYGVAILHLRCGPTEDRGSCAPGTGYGYPS